MRTGTGWCLFLYFATFALLRAQDAPSGENCTFRNDPDEFLLQDSRARAELVARTAKVAAGLRWAWERSALPAAVPASEIPRRNLIDVAIFDRLVAERVPSAPLTTDEEFLRRISLDLTGRIPSAAEMRAFLENNAPDKRAATIDRLLYSPEFNDRWTMWIGDWLGVTQQTVNINRQISGRNAMHDWVRFSLNADKPLKDLGYEALTAAGNNFETAAANYILQGRQSGGPVQDWYDLMFSQAADKFLGVSHYDCLLCHDGRGHLDELSVWGRRGTRLEAQRLAAFFSRTNMTQPALDRGNPLAGSWVVADRATGNYGIVTNYGNRPNRVAVGSLRTVDPEYRGAGPKSANWRADFAENVLADPLLAMNLANRIWKAMFNRGLVEPVNGLDPARLDPDNPPAAPWTLQASHPRLLRQLAAELTARNYSLREFVRLIAESSAYQLSARYDSEWTVAQAPLFARHYPRRLEAEEIHDAIAKSTGVMTNYLPAGWAEPVQWAVQFPDPSEPRANGTTLNFLAPFLRGNRDALTRQQTGSILQQLVLMNNTFVTTKVKVNASAKLRAVAAIANNNTVVDELFLTFLARQPSANELQEALAHFSKAPNRNAAVEDIAWALINKAEFLFSY
ncbi:MAG: DUF1553 domain-containing protein [Bryobacterales bacterium]|nr:DUF1553 domain-containing protein [Bryobacterales bacterium]